MPYSLGDKMNRDSQAPTKRVRIVLCASAFAVAAIVPGAGFAAEWSSGATTPAAEWSSGKKAPLAEWSSGKRTPTAEWSSGKRAPKAEWSSGTMRPVADWTSRYRASAVR